MYNFAKFLIFGAVNTAFGYLLFALLLQVVGPPEIALLIATVVGVLFNYFTTGRYVFDTRGYRALGPFLLAYAFIYLVNVVAINVIIALGVRAILAQLFCLPGLAVLSYFINAHFVFGKKP